MCVYFNSAAFRRLEILLCRALGKHLKILCLTKDRRRAIALRRFSPAVAGSHKRENVMGRYLLPYAAETDVITDHGFKHGFLHGIGLHT